MQLPPEVTHQNVAALYAATTQAGAALRQVNASALQRFDSSVLGLLLQAARVAAPDAQPLRVVRAPAALRALAQAYGIAACWDWDDA